MTVKFFKVGGAVRDALLGIESKDIDFSVEADSWDEMVAAVEARCTKVFLMTPEHFTMRGLDPTLGAVDFVLCRKDGPSSDGRRPDFVERGTILDDLARRDLTINAMAEMEDGTILDPHGGQMDLRLKRLRFVGEAQDRLNEDTLRAFRLLRFTITKGFHPDRAAWEAVKRLTLDDFTGVSTERMRDELFRCFAHDTALTLKTMANTWPNLLDVALERGIWFKPTTEKP